MPPRCADLQRAAIVTDDPRAAAHFSCALARERSYLAVLDGPRMTRDDSDGEVVRRNNALARLNAKRVILTGLPADATAAMLSKLPRQCAILCSPAEATAMAPAERRAREPLRWGRDGIGVGLLKALYEGRLIAFDEEPSPAPAPPGRSDHLVVCEAGEPLSEVIAANYAYALGAGLCIIPKVDDAEASSLLEAYYSIEDLGGAQAEVRQRLKFRLRELCGGLSVPRGGSITFFTRKAPFGAAFPELPSTHLFTYPDLGISVVNGFAAEQPGTRGVNVAVLVDPEKTRAPEIGAAAEILPRRKMLVRCYPGRSASVRSVTDMVDLYPYDLLIFATHCGDAAGYRRTYRFTDSEGRDRELVVDIALGLGQSDSPEMLQVMQFMRFHSLDGVDWSDPVAKADLHVGTAIRDFMERMRADELEPVRDEHVDRVAMSAAMAMHDHNYIAMPRALAEHGTPIVINNACVSWHELASRFTFAGARAYVGTLYPITDGEAESVVVNLLEKQWGKFLPHALWAAQKGTYGAGGDRHPYVVTGVYPQRLRVTRENVPLRMLTKLLAAHDSWKRRLGPSRMAMRGGARRPSWIITAGKPMPAAEPGSHASRVEADAAAPLEGQRSGTAV
jgi:hypothetical protein